MSATDDDEGKFGEITYSIDSPSVAKETFKIDNNGEYDNNLICTKKRTSCRLDIKLDIRMRSHRCKLSNRLDAS